MAIEVELRPEIKKAIDDYIGKSLSEWEHHSMEENVKLHKQLKVAKEKMVNALGLLLDDIADHARTRSEERTIYILQDGLTEIEGLEKESKTKPLTIFGKPVVESDDFPEVKDGDIVFGTYDDLGK